ncbi:glycosyltransferase family 39 protein [Blastopirellula retiformator]|uniref:Glycosyltransferase RgtA/B/C/D-like domain-containing protein n=1 Tax=Blastopirellula retiformator TaxID=2527970 RepID=A0A5C5V1P6_9BACT|nr:glycosyltransferase family 39 protein [Blastopirellula retiformator]TWT31697.1 hypothetical protein Enr8_36210 [Blastopirellula retiformator]
MTDSPFSWNVPLASRLFWRSLLLIALLGLGLRLLPLRESLWLDELHTAWVIDGDVSEIPRRAIEGNNGPLFFWLERLVVELFGASEWTLRMPSVVCGVTTLVLIGVLVRRWSGSGLAGITAALLVAVDRDMVFYATEARSYAAAQLGCLLLFALTMRLWRDFDRRTAVLWTLTAALTIHLHLTAALLVAACLPPLLLAAWGHRAWGRLALMLAGLGVGLLPLYPQLALVYSRRLNWTQFIHAGSSFRIIEILPIIPFGLAPLAIALVGNKLLPGRQADERQRNWTAHYVWTIFATLAPIAVAWYVTYLEITPLFLRRYLIGSQAMLFVWAGLNVARIEFRGLRILVAVTMASSIFFFHLPDHWTHQRRQDWRGAIATIDQLELPPEATLMVSSGLIESNELVANDDALADFCRLPVAALYRPQTPFPQVIPLRNGDPELLQPWQADMVTEPQTIVVMEPGDPAFAAELAVKAAQSLPWASTTRILPGHRGMRVVLVTPAEESASD